MIKYSNSHLISIRSVYDIDTLYIGNRSILSFSSNGICFDITNMFKSYNS